MGGRGTCAVSGTDLVSTKVENFLFTAFRRDSRCLLSVLFIQMLENFWPLIFGSVAILTVKKTAKSGKI